MCGPPRCRPEATRHYGQLAHRSFEVAQASELADSAIRVAILELTSPVQQQTAVPPPATLTVRIFGQPTAVQIEREVRRVDLNAADEPVLASALAGDAMEQADAQELAARIVDWRDGDDETTAHGAERAEYRRAGRSSGPRNNAFETISELRRVLGAETLTDAALDAFTVYSHAREHSTDTLRYRTNDNEERAGRIPEDFIVSKIDRKSTPRIAHFLIRCIPPIT